MGKARHGRSHFLCHQPRRQSTLCVLQPESRPACREHPKGGRNVAGHDAPIAPPWRCLQTTPRQHHHPTLLNTGHSAALKKRLATRLPTLERCCLSTLAAPETARRPGLPPCRWQNMPSANNHRWAPPSPASRRRKIRQATARASGCDPSPQTARLRQC